MKRQNVNAPVLYSSRVAWYWSTVVIQTYILFMEVDINCDSISDLKSYCRIVGLGSRPRKILGRLQGSFLVLCFVYIVEYIFAVISY